MAAANPQVNINVLRNGVLALSEATFANRLENQGRGNVRALNRIRENLEAMPFDQLRALATRDAAGANDKVGLRPDHLANLLTVPRLREYGAYINDLPEGTAGKVQLLADFHDAEVIADQRIAPEVDADDAAVAAADAHVAANRGRGAAAAARGRGAARGGRGAGRGGRGGLAGQNAPAPADNIAPAGPADANAPQPPVNANADAQPAAVDANAPQQPADANANAPQPPVAPAPQQQPGILGFFGGLFGNNNAAANAPANNVAANAPANNVAANAPANNVAANAPANNVAANAPVNNVAANAPANNVAANAPANNVAANAPANNAAANAPANNVALNVARLNAIFAQQPAGGQPQPPRAANAQQPAAANANANANANAAAQPAANANAPAPRQPILNHPRHGAQPAATPAKDLGKLARLKKAGIV